MGGVRENWLQCGSLQLQSLRAPPEPLSTPTLCTAWQLSNECVCVSVSVSVSVSVYISVYVSLSLSVFVWIWNRHPLQCEFGRVRGQTKMHLHGPNPPGLSSGLQQTSPALPLDPVDRPGPPGTLPINSGRSFQLQAWLCALPVVDHWQTSKVAPCPSRMRTFTEIQRHCNILNDSDSRKLTGSPFLTQGSAEQISA